MDTVRFTIQRKRALAGAILPDQIYINGQHVGTLRNGKRITTEVPWANAYYIEDAVFSERNAVVYDHGQREQHILLKRAGGWRTTSYNEFYVEQDCELVQAPSFHFCGFSGAVFEENIDHLSEDEQVLALCMAFEYGIRDDMQEILASRDLFRIIEALQTIKANEYAGLLLQIIQSDFCDVQLPLCDEQIEQAQDRIERANKTIWSNKSAYDEFHKAAVQYMMTKFHHAAYIY